MVKAYKEKTIKLFKSLSNFFKNHLPEIVFLVFAVQLLIYLNAFPYFNIIDKYYYYVTAVIWVLLNILFRRYITNKIILIIGILTFFITIPFTFLGLDPISETFGFLAFLLLFTYVVREIFTQKNLLRNS